MSQLYYYSPCVILLYLSFAQGSKLGTTCQHQTHFQNKDGLCCNLCLPGEYMEKVCSKGQPTVCKPCSPGSFSDVADDTQWCDKCTSCEQVTVVACSSRADSRCSCEDGYQCSNRTCSRCVKKLVCGKGRELQKLGDFDYEYKCVNCPNNTFSNTKDGLCKELTQCEKLGMKEISPGNRTHDTICGQDTAVISRWGIIVLVLLLLILLCSWLWMGNYCITAAKKNNIAPMAINPMENTQSCPLSKEEKGDLPVRVIDNKTSLSLKLSFIEQSPNFVV